ncbi:hypothetical protein LTS18_006721, partial [Coniosporium uncinatum]
MSPEQNDDVIEGNVRPGDVIEAPDGSQKVAIVDEQGTLKYQLLGPSLTKAGQDDVDQQRVSEIIYNSSKGSKFFNNEENRDKNLTVKIQRLLAKKRELERLRLSSDLRRADEYIAQLEATRDLTQAVVHIDCDAFYAAVEQLDHPELKDVPFAVGKGVLTTCNYHARKFGCRSAMAGFVAMKLCPQLVCLPLNFTKYTAKAEEVRGVLKEFDPNFESASIDEAYLNVTKYCEEHDMNPQEAVQQLRAEVKERCKITISAGIAPNAKLAKICSNKNKPDGQYFMQPDRQEVLRFMRDLPTRKVNGIGRVFERELDAIGIKTCGDIYEHRGILAKLFGEKAFQFLMTCYLGLGRTNICPPDESTRKSVGTESTFGDLSGKTALRDKLRHIAEELEHDLDRTQYKGRTLCLKIKLHTYEVHTRQVQPPKAINKKGDLFRYAEPMLTKFEKEIPNPKLRLMGLRVTHLVSTRKDDVDFFGVKRPPTSTSRSSHADAKTDEDGWQVWPEEEFEEAARQERQDDMDELERLSQERSDHLNLEQQGESETTREGKDAYKDCTFPRHYRESPKSNRSAARYKESQDDAPAVKEEFWDCPICERPQAANDKALN